MIKREIQIGIWSVCEDEIGSLSISKRHVPTPGYGTVFTKELIIDRGDRRDLLIALMKAEDIEDELVALVDVRNSYTLDEPRQCIAGMSGDRIRCGNWANAGRLYCAEHA